MKLATLDTKVCQCEHVAHFDSDLRTPNGNPAHTYGAEYNVDLMVFVKTIFGGFTVCPDCDKDCLAPDALRRV